MITENYSVTILACEFHLNIWTIALNTRCFFKQNQINSNFDTFWRQCDCDNRTANLSFNSDFETDSIAYIREVNN